MTLLEKLLDENYDGIIVLKDKENNDIRFEQIATIYVEDEPYFILHPLDKIEGTNAELFIFKVIEGETGDSMLVLETNDEVIDDVIKEYEALLSEE